VEVGLETKERVDKILLNIRTSVDPKEAVKEAHFVIAGDVPKSGGMVF
jgi:hypothetical protein